MIWHPFHPARYMLLACIVGCISHPAHATVEYALQGGAGWYHFDNPFMFRNNIAPSLVQRGYTDKLSDSAHAIDVAAAAFVPLPTDRSFLLLSGMASQIHNRDLTYINHTRKHWDALYQWELGRVFRGKLYHRADARPMDYSDGMTDRRLPEERRLPDGSSFREKYLTEHDMPHTRHDEVEIALRVTPQFDIPYTRTWQNRRYRNDVNITPFSMDNRMEQLAVRYESGTKSTLLAGFRRSDTTFPYRTAAELARYDAGFREREWFIDTFWRLSEYTIFYISLARVNRQFDTQHQRNLKKIHLGLNWHATPKTTHYLRIWDRPENIDDDGDKLSLLVRGANLRTVWQATWKTRLISMVSLEQDRYETFSDAAGTAIRRIQNSNKLLRLGLRMDYNITPRLTVTSHVNHQRSLSEAGHKRTTVYAGIRYSFENMTGNNRARLKLDSMQQ